MNPDLWSNLRAALPEFEAVVPEESRLAVAFVLSDDYAARNGNACLCWPGTAAPEFRPHDGRIGADWGLLLVISRAALDQIAAQGGGRIAPMVRSGDLKPFVLKPLEALEDAGLDEFVEVLGLVFPKH